jgi:hypothetical protein
VVSVNDYYQGSEMSVLTADKFVKDHIKTDTIALDLKLYNTKWWDYRVMHPAHATHYFYHLYYEILPGHLERNFGEGTKHHRPRPLRERNIQTIRGFWKARMAADAMGVPYEVYIRCMLDSFYEGYNAFATTKKMGHRTPFAVHMYSKSIIAKVYREWDELGRVELQIPESNLVLNQPVWFRAEMEAKLRSAALKTPYAEYFLAKARRAGAITSPD